ncbi:MAG TPA: hypothetical protein VNA25_23065 [Phycisphaerae bacterium]|nr:hypothetical protein [Phycisphaerae bacterium]
MELAELKHRILTMGVVDLRLQLVVLIEIVEQQAARLEALERRAEQ